METFEEAALFTNLTNLINKLWFESDSCYESISLRPNWWLTN